MKEDDQQMGPRWMDRFDLLRRVPERDPRSAAAGRAKFLGQVEALAGRGKRRPARPASALHFPFLRPGASPALKALVAVLLMLVLVFAGTATTVYAAQDSLPGQTLYALKTLSEDALISLMPSASGRLSLTLDFSDRRLEEMAALQSAGRPIPQSLVDRLQGELDRTLQLAAGMTDPAMAQSLDQAFRRTQGQLQAMAALVEHNPDAPLLAVVYARLQEQAGVVELGKTDPQGFRLKINRLSQDKNGAPGLEGTPTPHGNGNGNEGNPAEGTPGKGQDGKGNNKPTKTPGAHGHNPASP